MLRRPGCCERVQRHGGCVAVSLRVAIERTETIGCVAIAEGVESECINTGSRIAGADGVVKKRVLTVGPHTLWRMA